MELESGFVRVGSGRVGSRKVRVRSSGRAAFKNCRIVLGFVSNDLGASQLQVRPLALRVQFSPVIGRIGHRSVLWLPVPDTGLYIYIIYHIYKWK